MIALIGLRTSAAGQRPDIYPTSPASMITPSATNSINCCTHQPSSCCIKLKRRRRPLASAVAGSVIDAVEDHDIEQWHLPKQWLRQLGNGQIDSLKLLSVSGDSMMPRLLHGDIVMIDTSQRTASPPGIFVLHYGLGLVIKQIEPTLNTLPITLRMFSDNNADSAYDRPIDEVCIIGRVVWFARTSRTGVSFVPLLGQQPSPALPS